MTTTDLTGTRLRPLSAVERWYWICDQFSTLNVISRLRCDGPVSLDTLRTSLQILQERHPLLQRRIEAEPDGSDPYWLTCDQPIPLRVVSAPPAAAADEWIRQVNDHELIERVDPATGPLIRAVAIEHGDDRRDLLLVVPHIIADGTTVLALARQWLRLAAGLDRDLGARRELPPPELLLPPEHSGDAGAATLSEQLERDQALMARCRPGRVRPGTPVALDRRRTRLLHRELSPDQLTALVAACRRHRASVHGALTAALVLAAAADDRDRPDSDADSSAGQRYFAVGSPIDFRPELVPAVGPDEVGTYVATVPSVVDTAAEPWSLARSITADLSARKELGDHFCLVNMVVGACPPSQHAAVPFMQFMESDGPINLCSSNIGRFDFPDRIGQIRVSDAQFLTGISVNGYLVATINTSHERLFWNFTYIADAVTDERAERIADDCLARLAALVATPTISAEESPT